MLHGGDFFRSRGHTRQLARKLVNDKKFPNSSPGFFFSDPLTPTTLLHILALARSTCFSETEVGEIGDDNTLTAAHSTEQSTILLRSVNRSIAITIADYARGTEGTLDPEPESDQRQEL